MRKADTTKLDQASLIIWPVAWAGLYYAITLRAVRGYELHPIQAMFLMFGMIITGFLAAAAAGIWLTFLARRARQTAVTKLAFHEVMTYGAVAGALPMTALVGVYQLAYSDPLRAVTILGAVASASVVGALSAIVTSGIVALRMGVHA